MAGLEERTTHSEEHTIDVRSLDLGGDVVIITDRDGTIIDVNDAFVTMTGYSRREALGQTPRLLSSGYQDQAFYEELWQTVLDGEVWQGEMIDRRRDGGLRTYHATISPVKDAAGRVTHLVAVERDISRDLARQSSPGSTGLIHTDLRGNCVYADPQAAALLQAEPAQLLGSGLADRLDPDDVGPLEESIAFTAEEGRSHRLDVRTRSDESWLHLELAPLTVPSGAVIGAVIAVEDHSEQLAIHQALDRRDALLTSVLDALPDPVAVVAIDGTVLALNRAWRRRRREMPGDPVLAARVGEDIERRLARASAADDDEAAALLAELRRIRTTGVDGGPGQHDDHPRVGRYTIGPLAWDEGGFVLRRDDDPSAERRP